MCAIMMTFLAILSVANFECLALVRFDGNAIPVVNSGSVTLAQADHQQAPAATEFGNSCAGCYGVDGEGNDPMAVLPSRSSHPISPHWLWRMAKNSRSTMSCEPLTAPPSGRMGHATCRSGATDICRISQRHICKSPTVPRPPNPLFTQESLN